MSPCSSSAWGFGSRDAILVAVLLGSLVLYLILSDRVREIAAGSLTVELNEVSRAPVGDAALAPDLGPQSDPGNLIMRTDPNRSQIVTLTLGGHYQRHQVCRRLTDLAATSQVPVVIVVDDRQRVLAYLPYGSAIDLLTRGERGHQFIQLVNAGDPDIFDEGGGFSAVKTEILSYKATNAEALAAMESTGLETLVVADRKGRFKGIVDRDRLLS